MPAIPDCNDCGAKYRSFRCGLRFDEIYAVLRTETDPATGMPKRVTRHTVLGRMHETKRMYWGTAHGVGRCKPDPAAPPAPDLAWDDHAHEDLMDTSFDPSTFDRVEIAEGTPAPGPAPTAPRKRKARKPRAVVVAEGTPAPGPAPAAPASMRLRRFWCACGRRAAALIGAGTPACAHR